MTHRNTHRTSNHYTPEQLALADQLVAEHNAVVNPTGESFCAAGRPGYLMIDPTGRKHSYFTLYRYNNLALRNPVQFVQNLSTDLIKAVQKVATHTGLPILLNADDNFNPANVPHTCFQNGKYSGQPIADVYETDPQYVIWAANKFTAKNRKQQLVIDTLAAIKEAHFQMLTEQNQATCSSRYQGQIKQRLQFELTIYAEREFHNEWTGGIKTRYRATDADGNLFQFYSKHRLTKDQTYTLTGTVTRHVEYVGKQFTCINRVKVDMTPGFQPEDLHVLMA